MAVLRSVLVVLAGYAVFGVSAALLFQLSGRDPHAPQNLGFIIFAVSYGMVFAGVGGLLAAKLARSRRLLHACGVSVLIGVGATVSLVARPGAEATWSQWAALTLMAPSAWGAAAVRVSDWRRR